MPTPDLAELLAFDDDELYVLLAVQLQGKGVGVGPTGREAKRRFGRRWFEQWLEDNRLEICSHPAVVALLNDDEVNEKLDDTTLLVDFLLPFTGTLPVATIAVLVSRRGLRRICC